MSERIEIICSGVREVEPSYRECGICPTQKLMIELTDGRKWGRIVAVDGVELPQREAYQPLVWEKSLDNEKNACWCAEAREDEHIWLHRRLVNERLVWIVNDQTEAGMFNGLPEHENLCEAKAAAEELHRKAWEAEHNPPRVEFDRNELGKVVRDAEIACRVYTTRPADISEKDYHHAVGQAVADYVLAKIGGKACKS